MVMSKPTLTKKIIYLDDFLCSHKKDEWFIGEIPKLPRMDFSLPTVLR